ncbi:MAG: type II toxin-antitoxin system RelE/ParE family toxin [Cellvibrio sp.]
MSNYFIRQSAKEDLQEIWLYTITNWDSEQADSYISALFKRFSWLAENPTLGKIRTDIGENYYCFPEGIHSIFYVITENAIEIIAILHQRMDVLKHFD